MDFQFCPQCEALNPPGATHCEQCKAELPEVSDFAPPPALAPAEPESGLWEEPAPAQPARFEAAPEILTRVQQLEAEIAKRPSANALYLQLCQIYVDAKRKDLAIGVLENRLQHDPQNVYIRHRLGQLTGAAPSALPAGPVAAAPRAIPTASAALARAVRPPAPPPFRPPRRSSRKPMIVGAVAFVAVGILVKLFFFPGTQRVVTGSFSAVAPRWSPRGDHFAFLMQEGETTRLGVYDLRKGSHRPLAVVRGGDASAYAWSPEGRRIAYVGVGEGGWEEAVFVVPVEGGPPRGVASGSSPFWSVDGTELLMWCTGQGAPAESPSEDEPYFGGTPPGPCRVKQRFALSPNGKRIVYEVLAETGTLTNAKTRSELWLMSR